MKKLLLPLFLLYAQISFAQVDETKTRGANEKTPSHSQYFTWINNTNEGATEQQTKVNLEFFKWLHDEYGMVLDIYAMDAGVLDSKLIYGSLTSERFKRIFPNGFSKVVKQAAEMQTRLGVWGGPDGFGNTKEETEKRKNEIISLCKDYNWALFKFDAVCGPLRAEMEDEFIDMMIKCREYCPDLVLLNHRLGLTEAEKYATTFLWGGQETYVDVHTSNNCTAPHNRVGVMQRGLVPDLKRLTEDHGVCISSCVDYWQDDLILQAFNRSLILAPEIYGNPWLLSDEEYPLLARIYNLHRRFGDILVNGIVLPSSYGESAVSRGDDNTRFITLRNNSWTDKTVSVKLNEEIGLNTKGEIELRRFHPSESILGTYKYGETVEVIVPAFRSLMLIASASDTKEIGVKGTDYNIICDKEGKELEIDLLGMPGTSATIALPENIKAKQITIDGERVSALEKGKSVKVKFTGTKLKEKFNRKISDMTASSVPQDADALYEATVFAADNNALEVRSLERSGETSIEAVQATRDAFFGQSTFVNRGLWDKNLFDGDMQTAFWASERYGVDQRVKGGCFRLDLGKETYVEKVVIRTGSEYNLQPLLMVEGNYAYTSTDLNTWELIIYPADTDCTLDINRTMRYLKLPSYPNCICEIEVYGKNGTKIDPSSFRASNLFANSSNMKALNCYHTSFTLNEVAKDSYLCVAISGEHGVEGAYATAKIDGEYVGAPLRATSYPSNTWEYVNSRSNSNYTYYIPIDSSAIGKEIEIYVMGYEANKLNFTPEVWIWTKDTPYEKKRMVIEK